MSVIDSVKRHFDDINQPKEILVPEWGDDDTPLKIFITPLTLRDQQVLYRRAKDDDLGVAGDTNIMKCTDREGNKLFDKGDKRALMVHADPKVIDKIAKEIFGEDKTDEDYEKNL